MCSSDRSEWWDPSVLLQLPCSRMQGQDVRLFWSEWSQDHQQPLPVWVQGAHVSSVHPLLVLTTHLSYTSCSFQRYMWLIITSSSQVDTHPDRTLTARLPSASSETLRPHYGCLRPPPVCIWRCCWQHAAQRTALLRCGFSELGGDPPQSGQWGMKNSVLSSASPHWTFQGTFCILFLKFLLFLWIDKWSWMCSVPVSSDAQWQTLPRCCCDSRRHVHLWRNCRQQCAQWGDVQIPG